MMSAFNLATVTLKNKNGFTLIELLIVISLIMLAISLVGPSTVKMVDKANAQAEYIHLQNQIKKISNGAFSSSAEYRFEFSNYKISLYKNNVKIQDSSFEYLSFDSQTIEINSRGYPSPENLIVDLPNRREELNLFRLVEGTSGKVEN